MSTRSAAPAALLATKLHRPRGSFDLVSRERLIEALDRGLAGQITLVSAATGFGKTTLVSAWTARLDARRRQAPETPIWAWLRLDEEDSLPQTFLGYVVAALRTAAPDACAETLAALRARHRSNGSTLVRILCNDLSVLAGRIVLVLDDYHTVRGQAVHDLLNEMIRHWPDPLHLVLVARTNPPLPLASLRAKGLIAEVRSRDLRFTGPEIGQFFRQALPEPLEAGTVALLEERTEGWAAGLHLAALSLRTADDEERLATALANADVNAADYLTAEVLSRQPPAIQSFLLRTALLDRFCADLCEAAVDAGDPEWPVRKCLDWIERADLFLIPLDGRREWYRYHRVFQELLRQRTGTEIGPDDARSLRLRAADWCAEQGLIEEALGHCIAAHDLDRAAQLMGSALREMLNGEEWPTLERWLHQLPDDFVQRHAGLQLVKAWALQLTWQLERQSRVIDQVEALLAEAGSSSTNPDDLAILRGQYHVIRAQERYFRNRPADTVAHCREALALLPESWTYCRGGAMVYLGMGMQALGDGGRAEAMLMEEITTQGAKANAYSLRLLLTLCLNDLQAGDLGRLGRTSRTLLNRGNQGGLVFMQGWAHYLLGIVHYQWDQLEPAGQHFGWVVDHRHQSLAFCARASYMGLALIRQALGDASGARDVTELLGGFEVEVLGEESERTRSLRARLRLMSGDAVGASRWARSFTDPPTDGPLMWIEEPYLTRSEILLSRGVEHDSRAALDLLGGLLDIAERTHNTRHEIEIHARRALALDACGKVPEAKSALRRAVELSTRGGFVRAFADLGEAMRRLLLALAGQGGDVQELDRILAAFPAAPATPRPLGSSPGSTRADPLPPVVLTPRELQVLLLLREPLSPKVIARQLGVSHATVKRHTANLHGKLEVGSRWEAVAAAEARGIVPPR